ncbi:hypothetical protein [Spiroplasma endosymbiont of 'Nebria riversi']|nr:hypothetical protein [Spiroplasma endosymbiont of 'Nebria riversi']
MNIAIGLIFIIISIMLLAYFAYKIYAMVWQPFFGHFLCRLSFSKFDRR